MESENIYKLIFDKANDAIAIVDPASMKFVEVNQTACEKLGYSHEELTGMSPLQISSPGYAADIPWRMEKLFREGRDNYEAELRRKDGQPILVEMSMSLLNAGGATRILGIIRDITGRRRIEEALRTSEMQFRSVTSSAKDTIYLKDRELRYTMVNPALEELIKKKLGIGREGVIGKTAKEIFGEKTGGEIEEADRSVLSGEVIASPHNELIDGEERTYLIMKSPVRDEAGNIFGICGISRDVTSYRRAVEASKLDEARLEALVELSRMEGATQSQLADFALEQGVKLTGSEIGYLAFTEEDETVLSMYAWNSAAMAECAVKDKPIKYPMETVGLWGEAVRQRKAQITNDYAAPDPHKRGIPEGHCEIRRHMNTPVFDGGRIVAVAGVGNKKDPYNNSDVRQLSLLMDGMWKMALRARAEEAVKTSRRRLSDIIDFLPDATFVIDAEGKVIAWNKAMEELTGRPANEILGLANYEYSIPVYGERRPMLTDLLLSKDESIAKLYQGLSEHGDTIVSPEMFAPGIGPDGAWVWAKASLLYDAEGKLAGAIESIRDVTEIRRARERLAELSRISISALEEERTRISRELHDELGQQLAALSVEIECMSMQNELKKENLDNMIGIIESTTGELRRIYKGLRPPILDDIGLEAAMEALAGEFRRRSPDIEITTHFSGAVAAGGAGHEEICFYRILQESLNNIARHSGATAAHIEFIREGGELALRIRDNGRGFDVSSVGGRCFGIAGMRERAAICGGRLEVESWPGEGTVVTMRAPAGNQTGENQ